MRQNIEKTLKYSTRVLVDSKVVGRGGEKAWSVVKIQTFYSFEKLQKESAHLTIGVSHLLLPLLHISKIIDDRLGQVLQSPQLNFQGLQFLHLGNLGEKNYLLKENQQQQP